jgi:hypothetical protein
MSRLDQEEIDLFNGLIYQYLLDYPHKDLVGVTAKELREHYGLSPKNSDKFAVVLCRYQRLFYLVGQDRDGDEEGEGHIPRVRYYISLKKPNQTAQPECANPIAHGRNRAAARNLQGTLS